MKLSPTEKKRKRLLGDIFLGLENGNFGSLLPGWHDHGSISAIDVNTGKQVWKFQTPEPERGGVSTTDSGLGFAGGGDGVLRAFDLKTGKVLWTFQTGHQIAAGPSIYSVDGKEYIAITSGGTPTSSNGGVASELQIFALGGSKQRVEAAAAHSPAARAPRTRARRARATPAPRPRAGARASARARGAGRMTHADRPRRAGRGRANSNNTRDAVGRVLYGRQPVAGARVTRRRLRCSRRRRRRTGASSTRVDITVAGRHVATVTGTRRGDRRRARRCRRRSVGGAGLAGGLQRRLPHRRPQGARQPNGTVLVTGRVHDAGGGARRRSSSTRTS